MLLFFLWILVMLITIMIVIVLLSIIILLGRIQIHIINIEKNKQVIIRIKFFKITIIKILLQNEKIKKDIFSLEKLIKKEKRNKNKSKNKIIKEKDEIDVSEQIQILKIIEKQIRNKKIKIDVEKLQMNININTQSPILNISLIIGISSMIPTLINIYAYKINLNKYSFKCESMNQKQASKIDLIFSSNIREWLKILKKIAINNL